MRCPAWPSSATSPMSIKPLLLASANALVLFELEAVLVGLTNASVVWSMQT